MALGFEHVRPQDNEMTFTLRACTVKRRWPCQSVPDVIFLRGKDFHRWTCDIRVACVVTERVSVHH